MPFRPRGRHAPPEDSRPRGRSDPPPSPTKQLSSQQRQRDFMSRRQYPYSSSSHGDVQKNFLPDLYVALGGKKGLETAVERFYEKLVTDPKLERFFSNVDLVLLKAHKFNLIRYALSTRTTTTPPLPPSSPSSASSSSASSAAHSSTIKSSISIASNGSSSNDPENQFREFLRRRHERLFEMGLDETHLDRAVSHLESTLREMHVSNRVIEQAKERLWPLRSTVFQEGAARFQKETGKSDLSKRKSRPMDLRKPWNGGITNMRVGRMTPFLIMSVSTGVALLAIFVTLWDLPPATSGMLVVPDWGQAV